MRFTSIWLENFRGFSEKQVVPLHPELTVLVGVNGVGKSSVLDAAASFLSGLVSLLGGARSAWFGGDRTHIFRDADQASWGLSWLERGESDDGWRPALTIRRSPDATNRQDTIPSWRGYSHWENLRDNVSSLSTVLPYLGFVHSSSTRPAVAYPSQVALKGRLLAYDGAFDSESIQFDALSDWFEQEENLENQEKFRTGSLKRELPSLHAVRTAVKRFLNMLRGVKLDDLTVIRSHSDNPLKPARGRLSIGKGGNPLFIEQLSDGERRLILLVADTARRMVVLNPKLDDPLETPGLLLLDEVELHLHPQWQRTVVAALRAAFPKIQFVIATHAPAVLATVPNECVVVLEEGKVLTGTAQVFGRDPNTILSTLMETPLRPDEIQKELDALFSEVDHSPRKAKNRLKKLEEKIGADDPDLVRARALMQFLVG